MLESVRPATPLDALKRFFGYEAFRSGQEEIIGSVLAGEDTLVIMPTGGGKSLCYQIPAILMKGVTIVVSPLIALMKDQVDALKRRGVQATTINSTLEFAEVRQRMTDIRYGLYSLVYVAPERFDSQSFLELMKEVPVSLFAVDEAHCISEWGHDFRPSYLKLREAIEHVGRPPVAALTATATPFVQEDIIRQLGLHQARRFVRGFDRPNLSYEVVKTQDKAAALRSLMKEEVKGGGSVMIYCGTRRTVESVGMMLHAEKLPVTIYHAGLREQERRTAQENFLSDRSKIIVATNAFGMGIDKPNVRRVVHYEIPGSIEAYYQEAGRAGRDGNASMCTILYRPSDRRLQEFFIRCSYPDRAEIESVYNALWDMLHVGIGNRYEGVFVPDERTLVNRSKIHGASLQSVLNILEKGEVLRKVKADRLGMVRFLVSSDEVRAYYQRTRDPDRQKTIMALLRTLGGAALSQEMFINPEEVAAKYELTPEAFEQGIRALMMGGLLRYTPPTPGVGYQFLTERLPLRSLAVDERALEQGRSRALLKLDAVERYARTAECRRNFILEYFCAEVNGVCGRCDACRSGGGEPRTELEPWQRRAMEQILAAVIETGGRFGKMTIIGLLRGAPNATVRRFRMESYHRYGELRDIERTELVRLTDILVERGLLEISASLKPTVRITGAGRKAVRRLTMQRFVPKAEGPGRSRNPELLLKLQHERARIAEQKSMKPGLVCPDPVLRAIADELPTTPTEFMAVSGATEKIFSFCGAPFIGLVEAAVNESYWNEGVPEDMPDRLRRTYVLLQEGLTLDEIARYSALQPSTISNHIEDLIRRGVEVDVRRLVPGSLLDSVQEVLSEYPHTRLQTLHARLGGVGGYPELRVAAAWVRAGKMEKDVES